ncbi:pyrroline-5-carboxylate reductase [Mesorhizobium sp.]|uniref:pyrroline-5-carboxylate reductase n=1 Tax=Mesorhizobium sp. TaxID=1871066 RepID=UPI0025E126FF|nr:pyrroline-5-carboxylate reductase [Mesorhizobium sp.]
MIWGFVGTGTITEAIVTGMMSSGLDVSRVVVSPRNAAVAARLAARYPKVQIAKDNQQVVDIADVVILAVRPQIARDAISDLDIPKGKRIVSLIAGSNHRLLQEWTGLDERNITRAIPLPFVANRTGVTAIFPADPIAETLFSALGDAVACRSEEEYDLIGSASCLMGTYFGLLERAQDWLVGKGLEPGIARSYLLPLFGSLADAAIASPATSFMELRREFSTPGGLNEQVFRDFDETGATKVLHHALDRVLSRIRAEPFQG